MFLDFDGVILESAATKTDAFRDLFPEDPDLAASIHRANEGMPRRDKLRRIYATLQGEAPSEVVLDRLTTQFADRVSQVLSRCRLVSGVQDLLTEFSSEIEFFVASAAPRDEVLLQLQERRLETCFRGVFGAPAPKREIIAAVLDSRRTSSAAALFVGDTLADKRAATDAGVSFVARRAEDHSLCSSEGLPSIDDMRGLTALLRTGLEGVRA